MIKPCNKQTQHKQTKHNLTSPTVSAVLRIEKHIIYLLHRLVGDNKPLARLQPGL